MWVIQTHFLARYWFLKWGSKFRIFHETSKIFNDFSRENHGHGGHERGVRRGILGVSFHLRRCPQGVASVLFKKTPIFGSGRSKLDHLTVGWPCTRSTTSLNSTSRPCWPESTWAAMQPLVAAGRGVYKSALINTASDYLSASSLSMYVRRRNTLLKFLWGY